MPFGAVDVKNISICEGNAYFALTLFLFQACSVA